MSGTSTLFTIFGVLAAICIITNASPDADGIVTEALKSAPAPVSDDAEVVADDLVGTEFVEEATPDWKAERAQVWKADGEMLEGSDKAMAGVLKEEMHSETSVQWDRYLRHKGIRSPRAEGHKWQVNGKETEGVLLEKSEDVSRLCDQKVEQKHGYFHISGGRDKHYFYWLFEAKHKPRDAPLVLWLTGGPGCSSEVALFTENGPCKVNRDGKSTTPNPHSWNNVANIVYVDQPADTGFSYGRGQSDIDNTESAISEDLYHFMQEFVKRYPQFHKNDMYLWGESYAGHYVPATARRIMQKNQDHDGEYIAMRGLAIGNGLTAPEVQYQYYPQMAFHSKTTPKVVSRKQYKRMERSLSICVPEIKKCQTKNSACSDAYDICNAALIDPVQMSGRDVYDLRRPCGPFPLCGDYSHVSKYLRSDRVKKILGVEKTWHTCNFNVNGMFQTDWMKDMSHNIPHLLANGYRVLIYAGDVDFICNWMGNKAWTLKLDWPGKEEFNKAEDREWQAGDMQPAGWERYYKNFAFVRVHNAGHMVPQDQPVSALKLASSFLAGKRLVDEDQHEKRHRHD